MVAHLMATVRNEIEQLAQNMQKSLMPKIGSSFDLARMKDFGSAFTEILAARIEGRAANHMLFNNIDPLDVRLLDRISDAMQLADLKNHCACVLQGVHDDKSALEYLKKRHDDKLNGCVVDENAVLIERPSAGLIRFFVTREIFEALSPAGSSAQALASPAMDSDQVSFTVYRSSCRHDSAYLDENIPHETMHIFFAPTVAKVLGVSVPEEVLEERREFRAFAFSRYIDEALAQAVGGEMFGFSAPLVHKGCEKFRQTFQKEDPEGYESIQKAREDLHDLFTDSDFCSRMRKAGLSAEVLIALYVSSSSLEELRDSLRALHNQLPEVPVAPVLMGGWFAPL